MCLITFSYRQHPDYPLIFAANRDEHYKRPSRNAEFWDDHPNLLAGKDLKAGGTWMGITKQGTLAALTNYRDPSIQKDTPESRGHLVRDFLTNTEEAASYLQNVDKQAQNFEGFNLLAGTLNQLYYYSNQTNKIIQLDSGLYGLSNHLLDTPWPKVQGAKEKLQAMIQDDAVSEHALFNLLADDREAPEDQLPETGIPREIEKKVSPIFIKSDGYGTRASTVLLIDNKGQVTFTERNFAAGTQQVDDENRYQFSIQANQPV